MHKIYIATEVIKSREVCVNDHWREMFDLQEGVAPGCIGVMPVFKNKKKAKKYAGDHIVIEAYAEMEKKNGNV